MPEDLQTSIDIDAPPSDVWPVVSDLTRMPQWSPQCRKVLSRGPIGPGTTMLNINRSGWRVWPTRSVVTDYDPERLIGFRVKDNRSHWVFRLEPLDSDRTRLVQCRDVSRGLTSVSTALVDRFMGGEEEFEKDLLSGMRRTLAGIKAAVEERPRAHRG